MSRKRGRRFKLKNEPEINVTSGERLRVKTTYRQLQDGPGGWENVMYGFGLGG